MERVARKKPLASLKNWKARDAFEREHLTWSTVDWTKVFSDQSKFNRFVSDGKKYVRRRPGEEFMPKCTIPTINHGGGSVMAWAAFSRNGLGPLHIAEGIMDSTSYARILQDNLLSYVGNVMTRWLLRKKITKMEWPSQSPDLNPIINLWNDVEKEVQMAKSIQY
uniref:DDE-1 domain-containing protein n=1 Tax=Heterorhabditis bacteriophora TaxID=37862 RepID=A0A1I7WPC1_HETBA